MPNIDLVQNLEWLLMPVLFCKGYGGDMFAYIDVPKRETVMKIAEVCVCVYIYIYIIWAKACLYATALSLSLFCLLKLLHF